MLINDKEKLFYHFDIIDNEPTFKPGFHISSINIRRKNFIGCNAKKDNEQAIINEFKLKHNL